MSTSDHLSDGNSAAALTALLRQSGALRHGAVVSVSQGANPAFNSQVEHLQLTYSAGAPPELPTRLILKRNLDAAWAVRAGAREVAFYRHVATLPDGDLPMILRPLAATHDPATGRSQLLLPDLSETHREPTERARVLALDGVPTEDELDAVVDTLAAFHAYWWEHPALGSTSLPMDDALATPGGFHKSIERISANWATFTATHGDNVPPGEWARCELALSQLPRFWEQFLAGRLPLRRRITLCHNDCYFAAFLYPRSADDHRAVMIDWQGPAVGIGARDLVYLFGTFWTSEQRRAGDRERRLLRRYHAGLGAHGVSDYTWDELTRDYRVMIALLLFLPIWDAVNGSRRAYWWPKFSCLCAAYHDWQCHELVG